MTTDSPDVGSRPWLHDFARAVRHTTLELFDISNTCIGSTAIGLAVLERFGLSARPLSVWVEAINAKAYRLKDQGVPVAQWPDDAWSVVSHPDARATDRPHDGTGWSGHLVIILRNPAVGGRTLIDLTADQFDRPAHDLIVGGPVFMDIGRDQLFTPAEPLTSPMRNSETNPTVVSYSPAAPGHPEANAWKTTPQWLRWSDPTHNAPVVDAIVDFLAHMPQGEPDA